MRKKDPVNPFSGNVNRIKSSEPPPGAFLTPEEATRRYRVPLSFWHGRGKSRPHIPGLIRVGRWLRINAEQFEAAFDGKAPRRTKARAERSPGQVILQPGTYQCSPCGYVAHVAHPVSPDRLHCPQCGATGQAKRVG